MCMTVGAWCGCNERERERERERVYTYSISLHLHQLHRIGELESRLEKKNEAAVLLEEQKREQEEKIKELEASKLKIEQALAQAQEKVRSSQLAIYIATCRQLLTN